MNPPQGSPEDRPPLVPDAAASTILIERCYSPDERQWYCELVLSETGETLHTTRGFPNPAEADQAGLAAKAAAEKAFAELGFVDKALAAYFAGEKEGEK